MQQSSSIDPEGTLTRWQDMEGPPVAYFEWEFSIESEWTLIRRCSHPNPHAPRPEYKELGVTNVWTAEFY